MSSRRGIKEKLMSKFDPFKVCMACKYLSYEQGYPDISEVTPGRPPSFECNKYHWSEDLWEDLEARQLYVLMDKAKTCKDFELRTEEK